MDSKPSSLPDQTETLQNWWGSWEKITWPTKRQRQKTKTMTNTFREHHQRAIFETFDHWDIWLEWWENMTWPTKRQRQRQRQIQWPIHLDKTFKERSLRHLIRVMRKYDLTNKRTTRKTNTKTMPNTFRKRLKEHSLRLLTFETFDQSDDKT